MEGILARVLAITTVRGKIGMGMMVQLCKDSSYNYEYNYEKQRCRAGHHCERLRLLVQSKATAELRFLTLHVYRSPPALHSNPQDVR